MPNKASEETLARVQEAIATLNYRPMRAGIALRTKQTRLVALLIPDTSNSFYGAIAASVEHALAADGLAMILCNTAEDPIAQDSYLEEMRAQMVRGIALLGAVESPGLVNLVKAREPILFVNRPPPGGLVAPFVGVNDEAAGRDVARYFLACNVKRPAVAHGPLSSAASAARLRGFLAMMAEGGRPVSTDHIQGAALKMESGYRAAILLFERSPRPTSIFCGNDLIAYGIYRLCRERGLSVPGDVGLFGFDDNPMNQWIAPWLSTVRVPCDAFGPAVRDLFNGIWSGVRGKRTPEVILPHELVRRQSVL